MEFFEWKYHNVASIPERPGIYLLFTNSTIPNIYKNDPKGILYIGKTKNLNRRLHCVKKPDWKSFYQKKSEIMFNHSALTFVVDFYNENDFKLILHDELFEDGYLKDISNLYLKYSISTNYEEDEATLLNGHMMLYGQPPPFNTTGCSLKTIWNAEDEVWQYSAEFCRKIMAML